MRQYDRFKDAPWFKPEEREEVLVGGAGGIGSWLAFLLSRAGFKPTVYDNDTVETHNLGGQLFRHSDVGSYKTSALYNIVKEFSGDEINTLVSKYTNTSPNHWFMFAAFDNMEARRDFFNSWKRGLENSLVAPILIDGRLTMDQLQIFCVTPNNMDRYEAEYLFDDSEVEDISCTARQTSHCAAMIASHMVGFFTNHLTNIYEREIIMQVPFLYEYNISFNLTSDL